MITIIICTLTVPVLFLIRDYKEYKEGKYDISLFLIGLIPFLILGAVAGLGISIFIPTHSYEKETIMPITTLSDNNNLSGSFFLGTGKVGDKMVYVMYVNNRNGFTMKQIPSDKAIIRYTTDEPLLKSYELRPHDDYYSLFGINLNWGNIRYVIQVPKGTIQNSYKLDAQ